VSAGIPPAVSLWRRASTLPARRALLDHCLGIRHEWRLRWRSYTAFGGVAATVDLSYDKCGSKERDKHHEGMDTAPAHLQGSSPSSRTPRVTFIVDVSGSA
jgi:hypothetical protein